MTCLHCSKVDYWRWNETVGGKEMIVERYSKTPYLTNFIVWLIYHKSKSLVCIKTDWRKMIDKLGSKTSSVEDIRHADIARREKKAYVDVCQSNFFSNYRTYHQGIKFYSHAFTHTKTVPTSSWEEKTSFTSQTLANLGLQFALTTSTIESCFHKKVGLCSHQSGYCQAGCKMKIGKDY